MIAGACAALLVGGCAIQSPSAVSTPTAVAPATSASSALPTVTLGTATPTPVTSGAPSPGTTVPSATVSPSATTPKPSATKAAPTASDSPITINGIVLVNPTHCISASYVPPWSASQPHGLSPEYNAALADLTTAAATKGLTLRVESAYRSYAEQTKVFNDAVRKYGYAKAAAYNALPGCSEHQTGLAADLTNASGAHGTAFNHTPEADFLAAHATEHGFIVRYPKGAKAITGYEWEPWHLRYVGKAVAAEFARRPGLTLEQYLGVA